MREDERTNETDRRESEALAQTLDRLNEGGYAGEAGGREPWDDLDRPLLELLGRLPEALEPRTPPVGVRERLLARAAEARDQGRGPGGAAADPFAARAERRAGEADGPGAADRRGRRSWTLPLAASLAAALFGLAGWQYLQIERQEAVIARLSSELATAVERLEASGGAAVDRRAQLAMMTRPGTEYCVLKPVGEASDYASAWATMVLSAERDRWYLRVEGLEPCSRGRTYKLWFLTEEGAVAAGAFDGSPGGGMIELTDRQVPEGIRGVAITLEEEPEAPSPTGPHLLFADQAMRLL